MQEKLSAMNGIYQTLLKKRETETKSFAVLLDPDKTNDTNLFKTIDKSIESNIDFFLVGGSLLMNNNLGNIVKTIKSNSSIPVILFPGSSLQIHPAADAILFLSLISGRNADFLIGQHVLAAPLLKKSELEIIPTGYMLVDGGKPTTVSYISNTTPIPHNKPDIASCTAMAGEMLGLKLLYMDAGSGAESPISKKMISAVRASCSLPLIAGGGINTAQKAMDALAAGADMIVIGNGIEKRPELLSEVSELIQELNIH